MLTICLLLDFKTKELGALYFITLKILKLLIMLRNFSDWGNTFAACSLFITGCVLSVVSWKLSTSWTFVALYMSVGTAGFINICLLGRKQTANKTEGDPLLPVKLIKNARNDNSKITVWDYKISDTENLLNVPHNIYGRKFKDHFTRQTHNYGSISSCKRPIKTILVLQHKSTTKKESTNPILGSKVNDICRLNEFKPHEDLLSLDLENKIYNFDSSHSDNRLNQDTETTTEKVAVSVLERNKVSEDFTKIAEVNNEKYRRYRNNALQSSDHNLFHTDRIFPITSQVPVGYYPTGTSAFESRSMWEKCILEREKSSEPTCLSCLCVNILPQIAPNDQHARTVL